MIKMIVSDLDGTLLNNEKKISNETNTYLKKLKEKGYLIVIATGRTCASALEATNGAEFTTFILFNQGAGIYDNQNKKMIYQKTINEEFVKKSLDLYDSSYNFIEIANANIMYKYWKKFENTPLVQSIFDKDYILKHCCKTSRITINMHNNLDVLNLYHNLKSKWNLSIILMQDSDTTKKWIDIMPHGCNKWKTVSLLAKYLKIKREEILFFGDGLNDTEMLEKCGVGVAMQNALPEVKQVANFITKYDNNHDGVIQFLNRIIN